jgi:pantoate--beta-alanine ligase
VELLFFKYFYRIYMHIIKASKDLSNLLDSIRRENPKVTIGFVPTMGALHEGHLSLLTESVSKADITVCSIFVNPTQFGEKQDLEKYPKPIENDIELLMQVNCDILFLPEYDQVYPSTYTHQKFELKDLDHKIEGASRPGHFQGVCNVLFRFFEIIKPNFAFFGQKDFQQTVVAKRLAQLMEQAPQIVVTPIKREAHGLAMSSRNIRLSNKGKMNAAFIYRALHQLKEDTAEMNLADALQKAKQFIGAQKGAEIDYLLAVDTITLDEVNSIDESQGIAVVTVIEYEGVRLLDNIILK